MQPYQRRRQNTGPTGQDLPQSSAPNRHDIDAAFKKADADGDGRLYQQEAAESSAICTGVATL